MPHRSVNEKIDALRKRHAEIDKLILHLEARKRTVLSRLAAAYIEQRQQTERD